MDTAHEVVRLQEECAALREERDDLREENEALGALLKDRVNEARLGARTGRYRANQIAQMLPAPRGRCMAPVDGGCPWPRMQRHGNNRGDYSLYCCAHDKRKQRGGDMTEFVYAQAARLGIGA